MDPSTVRHEAHHDLAEDEQHWRELSAELDAVDEQLRNMQPPEGAFITPEIFEQLEAAKRRRYKVQFAMLDFLDTLDDMPP